MVVDIVYNYHTITTIKVRKSILSPLWIICIFSNSYSHEEHLIFNDENVTYARSIHSRYYLYNIMNKKSNIIFHSYVF